MPSAYTTQARPSDEMIEQLLRAIEDESQDSGEPIEYTCRRQLVVFAQLVAEECAQMCESMFNRAATADECADAIRAKFGVKA